MEATFLLQIRETRIDCLRVCACQPTGGGSTLSAGRGIGRIFSRFYAGWRGSGFGDGGPPDTWGSQRRGVPGLTVILILILILILSLATTYDSIRACNQRGRMGWNPEYLSSFLRWSGLGRFSADDAFFGIRGTVRVERVGPGVDAAVTASLRTVGDGAGSGLASTLLSQRRYASLACAVPPGWVLNCSMIW